MYSIDQVAIALSGVVALALATAKGEGARRWAPVVGLAGQPFWLWATWGKWGMFTVSVLYTVVWARALWKTN